MLANGRLLDLSERREKGGRRREMEEKGEGLKREERLPPRLLLSQLECLSAQIYMHDNHGMVAALRHV